MEKLYQHQRDNPFHISVGAVLTNAKGEICVHKVKTSLLKPESRYRRTGLEEIFLLMRESIENGESLTDTLSRGLKEEFGAEGEVKRYLGSTQLQLLEDGGFEKTVLYFHAVLTKEGKPSPSPDEPPSVLAWINPETLLVTMQKQGSESVRGDLDEAKIIEAYLKYGTKRAEKKDD